MKDGSGNNIIAHSLTRPTSSYLSASGYFVNSKTPCLKNEWNLPTSCFVNGCSAISDTGDVEMFERIAKSALRYA